MELKSNSSAFISYHNPESPFHRFGLRLLAKYLSNRFKTTLNQTIWLIKHHVFLGPKIIFDDIECHYITCRIEIDLRTDQLIIPLPKNPKYIKFDIKGPFRGALVFNRVLWACEGMFRIKTSLLHYKFYYRRYIPFSYSPYLNKRLPNDLLGFVPQT